MPQPSQPTPSNFIAALWVSGWLISMVTMAVAGRETASRISAFQVMEIRAFIGMALLVPFIYMAGGLSAMKTSKPISHFTRNSVHFIAQFSWLIAVTLIPLAVVVSIEFTMPIWTAIFAVLFLGERMNVWKVAAIILGLAGVLIIVRPDAGRVDIGQLIALGAALGFAVAVIMTKSLTRTDSVTQIIFWMLIIQGAIGLIPAIYYWKPVPANLWPWLFLVAFVGTFSHYCMAQAMRYADATVVVPMDFLRVPLTAIVGWLVYNEVIDIFTFLGAALILSGNLLNLKRAAPPPDAK